MYVAPFKSRDVTKCFTETIIHKKYMQTRWIINPSDILMNRVTMSESSQHPLVESVTVEKHTANGIYRCKLVCLKGIIHENYKPCQGESY